MSRFAKVKIQGMYGLPKAHTAVTEALLDSVELFFRRHKGRVLGITGAGVSVASGIPDYRGPNGTYRVYGGYTPILHHELVLQHSSRQRYWARSFFGIRPAFLAKPNKIHFAMAGLEQKGYLGGLITQNVDSLHAQAGSKNVLELHGTLKNVKCIDCGHTEPRAEFQKRLEELNPQWVEFYQHMANYGEEPARRPDGDVELPPGLRYDAFEYPKCKSCKAGHYMPTVIFFGGNVPDDVRIRSFEMVDQAEALFVCGTSLATFSAYRLVKHAHDMGREIFVANLGETRGDKDATVKLDASAEEVVPPLAARLGIKVTDPIDP
ncbi:hypothetical protein J3B02_004338 [Coemansia erecta]|uniref:Deacetylase sirtuin-type domain-containing protein n=1 Tax=Coemansia asiatica TaxID=1052880 RepID=A0A9W7XLX0_9FUNG|nr:hypothetical protein LPJ64_001114 [Coemansia asiatica]KAJ2846721.1 hypothetical protein J3B02_004338 [Coemansia erecta]KAJ2888183.1 hypothetical protein FB639_000814 [Coemansia asiatica]